MIGYRALNFAQEAQRLCIYGFGAAAHIVTQLACYQGREVYAFTYPGDVATQQFSLDTGAYWAGNSSKAPPVALDAALLFAPVED
ncbi:hypothetical protein OL229_04905 [Neisseriaceae bacterium JH1-16]|nr:hypothetical protein [Neisseriaceae bacterium JH1-16]